MDLTSYFLFPGQLFSRASWAVDFAWAFWIGAAVIAMVGAWLLWHGLARDRDRGKRRCPKCWYEMSGVPGLRCPECGREHKNEKRLHRRRQRWVAAVAGAIALMAASATAWTPRVANRGWLASVPTWALVTAAWVYDTEDGDVLKAASERFDNSSYAALLAQPGWVPEEPTMIERWLLRRSAVNTLCSLPSSTPGHSLLLPSEKEGMARGVLERIFSAEPDPVPRAIKLTRHQHVRIRCVGLGFLSRFNDGRPSIREAVLARVETDDLDEFRMVLAFVDAKTNAISPPLREFAAGVRRHRCGFYRLAEMGDEGIDALIEMMDDPGNGSVVCQVLFDTRNARPEQLRRVLDLVSAGKEDTCRAWAAALAARWGHDDAETQAALVKATMDDPQGWVRHSALTALTETSIEESRLVEVLVRCLSDELSAVRYFSAWKLCQSPSAATRALGRLREIARDSHEDERTRVVAAQAVSLIEGRVTGEK